MLPIRNCPAPFLVLLALVLVLPTGAAAQSELAGHWQGTIELPGTELAFDVDLEEEDGAWSGDISIPAQGAQDLPLSGIAIDGDTVRFAIEGIPGDPTFEGTLADGGVTGTFRQGGGAFPFTMSGEPSLAETATVALEGFDSLVEQALEDFGVPGLAIAVVADDRVVFERGYGLRDVEAEKPVTPDTLFAIGSTSKAFTAFVLGTLVDEGRIEWDQPVSEILPEFRLADPHATRRLKVRDLVIHSSGLPRHDLAWYNSSANREELVERLRYLEPSRDLGEEFQYQNLMFLTAGYLAERVTGRSWEELVRERIFEPLGMERSNFSVVDSQEDPDHALPYSVEDRSAERIPFRNIDTVGPAGSINSSVREMTRWMRLQLAGGELDGKRVIETATLRQMHTPQMAISAYPDPASPALAMGYGMGWMVESHRGRFLVQHGGGIDGFISWVALLPFERLGVVVYTNGSGFNPLPTAVARTAIDRVLGLDEIDYLARAREQLTRFAAAQSEAERNKTARRQEGTSPSHPLDAYAGRYRHPGYGVVTVERADDGLRLLYNDIPVDLEHWHYEVWNGVVENGDPTFEDMKFSFRTDVDGWVSELVAPFEPAVEPLVFEKLADERLSDPEFLARFEGSYELQTQRATVSLRGDRLALSIPGQPTWTLEPKRGTEFAFEGLEGFSLEFLVDDAGAVTGARFIQPDGIYEAKRVED